MASDLAAVNLLAEESTIDPSSTLPSFLEMKLVQETAHAGRKAVHSSIDVVVEKCEHAMRNYPVGSLRQKLAKSLSQIFRRYQAELEMVVHYSIERHYLLSSANSLLSESLYGLRRSKISGNGSISPMNKSDGIRAALILSIWPFLKSRLDNCYEYERSKRDDEQANANEDRPIVSQIFEKNRSMFIYLYPFLHLSHDGVKLAYQFAYLIGKSVHFDPTLHALGLVVRRITKQDIDNSDRAQQKRVMPPLENQIPQHIVTRLKKAAAVGIASALMVGWLENFRQELIRSRRRLVLNNESPIGSSSGDYKASEVVVPPPPTPRPPLNDAEERIEPPRNKTLCPICLQKRVNPVASSSGNVFCYKCLVMHIREKGPKCPVTSVQCERSQIVQLYEPNAVTITTPDIDTNNN